MLVHESRKLGTKILETAARAYLLWNAPGVALTPPEYRRLRYLREYLCESECKTIKFATISPEGSVLASGVACQAFVGSLMHEIALNGISAGRDVVKEARETFCNGYLPLSIFFLINIIIIIIYHNFSRSSFIINY